MIATSLTAEQASARLATMVRPRMSVHQWLDNRQTDAERAIPFVGKIAGETFRFVPAVVSGRNSFVPLVTGRVAGCANGSELRLVIRLGAPVLLFTSFITAIMLISLITDGLSVVPVVIIVVLALVPGVLFVQERQRVLRRLRDAFPPPHAVPLQ